MKTLKSIFVILDKPKHAQVALERAKVIQEASSAHLHLASFAWLAMVEHKNVFTAEQRRILKKAAVQERKKWLRQLVVDSKLPTANVSFEVTFTRDIASRVSERIALGDIDLVIKSVHHSNALNHSSLDWRLIRRCRKPLLLVSTKPGRATGNVLAALALRHSDRRHRAMNRRVLDAAQRFADMGGGRMHCVSAVEYPLRETSHARRHSSYPLRATQSRDFLTVVSQDFDMSDIRKKQKLMHEDTDRLMEALLESYDVPRSRIFLPAGKVGHMVAATAHKVEADLIVVGTGAQRNSDEVLIGHAAEKILTRASCDVLAVQP